MKFYHKKVTVGIYEFGLSVDRDIVADSFERFPDLMEFLFSQKGGNDVNAVVIGAIKNKKVRQMLDSTEQIKELVKYAFPRMLAKADSIDGTNNVDKSQEIIDYIYENEVEDEFSNSVFEFICQGFTPDATEKKPKVKFTMN